MLQYLRQRALTASLRMAHWRLGIVKKSIANHSDDEVSQRMAESIDILFFGLIGYFDGRGWIANGAELAAEFMSGEWTVEQWKRAVAAAESIRESGGSLSEEAMRQAMSDEPS